MSYKIGFVGCGNMGKAMLSGVAGPGRDTATARRTSWKARPQRVKAP